MATNQNNQKGEEMIPVCKECGIWPVFEWRGVWTDGTEFSQGFNSRCCICEGLQEEPAPYVSEAINLGKAMNQLLDTIVESIEEEDDENN